MALTLNTPGVFVEEISLLPPSVAQVATAIPAFIGYTEKAEVPGGEILTNVPTRITSLLEYEMYFGKADPQQEIKVYVTGTVIKAELKPVHRSKFLMYYSLQMYFANGGGPCYIVSTGDYSNVVLGDLQTGLSQLEKKDEPTLILFPDATALPAADLYSLYNDALAQCSKLQDRFTIIDTRMKEVEDILNGDVAADMDALRSSISSNLNEIKYGAAYYPYLKTSLDYQYKDSDVKVTSPGADYATQVTAIGDSISDYENELNGYLPDLQALAALFTPETTSEQALNAIRPDIESKAKQIIETSELIAQDIEDAVAISRAVLKLNVADNNNYTTLFKATNDVDKWITDNIETTNLNLNVHLNTLAALDANNVPQDVKDILDLNITPLLDSLVVAITDFQANQLNDLIAALGFYSLPAPPPQNLDTLIGKKNALYNLIKAEISQIPVVLPPSSAVAGVYAKVDSNEGVWKAPANVSLNYTLGPLVNLTNDQQGGMNVDAVTGKSVNAIRSFTGRGTLVWGARTLAGNDNEWRYISVRRFYNMVEESAKNATQGFVFQGNDANTWVKVRAMIENFLVLQWKAGALAGAKSDQAFYVRVGLGQTMTADDVLNGRMIVEIGMAVVRPAEFIVLRFSHMMQQA